MRNFKLKHLFWMIPAALILVFAAYLASNLVTDNFHQVFPNQFYRSAQLPAKTLERLVKRYHIRSVINLRGPHPQASWYQGEIKVSAAENLHHYNLTPPAHGLPTYAELKKIVKTLQVAPHPILVHCRQGADRTGLVSAIEVILAGNASMDSVKTQISWKYGVVSPHTVGYQVMTNYFQWLTQQKLALSKASFLQWLDSDPALKPPQGLFLTI